MEPSLKVYRGMIWLTLYGATLGNPPDFSGRQKWSYAAIANFIAGVMPPSAMLGRSWLYVHSQRVALS